MPQHHPRATLSTPTHGTPEANRPQAPKAPVSSNSDILNPFMPSRALSHDPRYALNAICPYFTMFPLEFPLRILRRHRNHRLVLDPFCGRGTTLFAARARGLRAIGIDVSPVAISISQAKLASASIDDTLALARQLLHTTPQPDIPTGDFWHHAFHNVTLTEICLLRDGLARLTPFTHEAALLRATLLGVLHGPRTRTLSYLSNQMPRTFAPKPAYALKFWRRRNMLPPYVPTLHSLERKLRLVQTSIRRLPPVALYDAILGDAADPATFLQVPRAIDVVITSPPYYGMRTYIPDQWLRNWFLGGPPLVDYAATQTLPTSSPHEFANALGRVWANLTTRAREHLRLHVRFGAIPSRAVNARQLLLQSLESSGITWSIVSLRNARSADAGKRQARHMRTHVAAIDELDLHAMAT